MSVVRSKQEGFQGKTLTDSEGSQNCMYLLLFYMYILHTYDMICVYTSGTCGQARSQMLISSMFSISLCQQGGVGGMEGGKEGGREGPSIRSLRAQATLR